VLGERRDRHAAGYARLFRRAVRDRRFISPRRRTEPAHLSRALSAGAAARIIDITDQRLWRIIEHYVGQAVARLDLGRLKAIGLDETASKRRHNYVTVFIDLDRKQKPVVGERRGIPRLPTPAAGARGDVLEVDQAASLSTRARSNSRLR
jgi:hypothetical protein